MARYPKQDDPNGENVVPSVTEIISDCSQGPPLQWAANCCVDWIRENVGQEEIGIYPVTDEQLNNARFAYKTVSDKALDVGSEVHGLIEAYLLSIRKKSCITTAIFYDFIEKAKPEVKNAFDAFLKWSEEHNLKPIELEKTVYGDRWAGTLDIICELNNKIYVIDFKTSKRFYMSEMGAQIAAYRSCVPGAEACGILRLDKITGEPEFKDFSKRYESDLRVFNAMVELYYLRHPRIRKRFENG